MKTHRTGAPELSQSEAVKVLASFDPSSLQLNFNIAADGYTDSDVTDWRTVLQSVPTSILAHELTHFLQATASAAGFREFTYLLDLVSAADRLVDIAARLGKGTIHTPILQQKDRYTSSEEFQNARRFFCALLSQYLHYRGGWRQSNDSLQRTEDGSSNQLHQESGLIAFDVTWPYSTLYWDLHPFDASGQSVALGTLHLKEGMAKSIEMIQARLQNEPRLQATLGSSRIHLQESTEVRNLVDPYFITHLMYGGISQANPKFEPRASLEEFAVVSDLALMLDPLIIHFEHPELELDGPNSRFWTPMDAFLHLLATLGHTYRKQPRLSGAFKQAEVAAFQDSLLRAAGIPLTVIDLTAACKKFVERAKGTYTDRYPYMGKELLERYFKIFDAIIIWREEAHRGGSFTIDLLTSPSTLHDLIFEIVPAFIVGDNVYSPRGGFRPGEGLGVDMNNFAQMRSVLLSLVVGETNCPWHIELPRACAVPPHALCDKLESIRPQKQPRCVREQVLAGLRGAHKIRQIV